MENHKLTRDNIPLDTLRLIEERYKGFLPYVFVAMVGTSFQFALPEGYKFGKA